MAKMDFRSRGQIRGVLVAIDGEGNPTRLRKVEASFEKILGEKWLSSGESKEIAFTALRAVISRQQPAAFGFASAINRYNVTPKLLALPREEQTEVMKMSTPELLKHGWV